MSLLFIDGFEDGLHTYKWTSLWGSWVIATSGARTGSRYLIVAATSSPPGAMVYLGAANAHATYGLACGINYTSWTGSCPIHFLGDANTVQHIQVRGNSFGAIEVYRGGDTGNTLGTKIAESAPGQIVLGNWYHIEVKVVVHDTTGSVAVRINGVEVVSFTGDTRNGGAGTIDTVTLGGGAGTNNHSGANFDDVAVWNGAGTENNDWLGDCSVQTIYPTGNGNYSEWDGSDGNSTDNYLLVDEAGVPNTSDYVESGVLGEKDSYVFGDLPAGVSSIKGVAIRTYVAKSDAGAQLVRAFVRIAGTDYPGTDKGPSVSPAYLGFSDFMELSPATSAAWTAGELNAAEFGVEAR